MTDESGGLERFVEAQDRVYADVCNELDSGLKTSHWMWFIFPQLKELGRSTTAKHFGLAGVREAQAFWSHPVLRQRLEHCCQLLLGVRGRSAVDILGSTDAMKLRSSMTLFAAAEPDAPLFRLVLQKYFAGADDPETVRLLVRHD